METIKKNLNKLVILVVLVFIGTFIFNYIQEDETADIIEVKANDDQDAAEMIETLNELSKIKIETQFFEEDISSDAGNLISFSDLIDFSKYELAEKPIGKSNPFFLKEESGSVNINENTSNKNVDNSGEDKISLIESMSEEI